MAGRKQSSVSHGTAKVLVRMGDFSAAWMHRHCMQALPRGKYLHDRKQIQVKSMLIVN